MYVLTFLLEEHATFSHNDRHVTINEALAIFVGERDGHIGILDADI